MTRPDVFVKSSKGNEEVLTRKFHLPQRLRSLLIMIDGIRTVGFLQQQLALMGDVAAILGELEAGGFIERRTAMPAHQPEPVAEGGAPATVLTEDEQKRLEMGKNFMINTVLDAVGPIGSSLVEKLKKARRLEDLRLLLDSYTSIITSGSGNSCAKDYLQKMLKLLY